MLIAESIERDFDEGEGDEARGFLQQFEDCVRGGVLLLHRQRTAPKVDGERLDALSESFEDLLTLGVEQVVEILDADVAKEKASRRSEPRRGYAREYVETAVPRRDAPPARIDVVVEIEVGKYRVEDFGGETSGGGIDDGGRSSGGGRRCGDNF